MDKKTYTVLSNGYTLIEVVIAIAGFTIIVLGVVSLVSNIFTTNRLQSTLLADQDQARKMSFELTTNLRRAESANTGAFALAEASPQQLVFYANVDGGGDVERLRYFLDNGELKRGLVKPAGNPYTYNLGSEIVETVQRNVANGTDPLFYYYTGDYNGEEGDPLASPINLTAVRLVRMDLRIFNKGGAQNTATYTVTAMATVRSLKTNLGE